MALQYNQDRSKTGVFDDSKVSPQRISSTSSCMF